MEESLNSSCVECIHITRLVDCASQHFRMFAGTLWRRAYTVGGHQYRYQCCLVRICGIKSVSAKGNKKASEVSNLLIALYWDAETQTSWPKMLWNALEELSSFHYPSNWSDCFLLLLFSLKDALVPNWKQSINSQPLPLKGLGGSFLKYCSSDPCIFS